MYLTLIILQGEFSYNKLFKSSKEKTACTITNLQNYKDV